MIRAVICYAARVTTTEPALPHPLAGHRLAVTGANRGLGRALARAFVEAGAHVLVHARTPEEAALAKAEAGAAWAVDGDLRDPTLGPRLAAAAMEHLAPGLDTLVLSAGVLGPMGRLETIDLAVFREVMEINVDAQLGLFLAAREQLIANRGTVIWMSSGVGRFGLPGYGAYCVSKHAIEGLNRLAHVENSEAGLVSIAVAPGMVQTDMLRAAVGSDDVSRFTPPEVAAAGFVRLLEAIARRPAELAGGALEIADF